MPEFRPLKMNIDCLAQVSSLVLKKWAPLCVLLMFLGAKADPSVFMSEYTSEMYAARQGVNVSLTLSLSEVNPKISNCDAHSKFEVCCS